MTHKQFNNLKDGQLLTIKRSASKTVVVFEKKWFPKAGLNRRGIVHGGEFLYYAQLGIANMEDVIAAIKRDEERHNAFKEKLFNALKVNEETEKESNKNAE